MDGGGTGRGGAGRGHRLTNPWQQHATLDMIDREHGLYHTLVMIDREHGLCHTLAMIDKEYGLYHTLAHGTKLPRLHFRTEC